jgi:hypothetical protein
MAYSTGLQVYVFDCPDAERQAAGEVLAGMNSEDAHNGTHYALVDDTLNADGKPIRRGQEALTVGTFPARELAEEYSAGMPGAGDERYSIDDVPVVTIGERYLAQDVSCSSAGEYGDALREAAPGASFVLWEDPAYEWLGTLYAYAPDLGVFTAECDQDGTVVLSQDVTLQAVRGATDAVRAALEGIQGPAGSEERARAAVDAVLAELDRAAGKQWIDRWEQARLAESQQDTEAQPAQPPAESGAQARMGAAVARGPEDGPAALEL